MGYLAAPENIITHLANTRVLLDRQGDHILDNAMAELLNDGTVYRFIRKALTIYGKRRDHFCNLLKDELNGITDFSVPEGGMTVWARFDASIHLEELARQAYKKVFIFQTAFCTVIPATAKTLPGSGLHLHPRRAHAKRIDHKKADSYKIRRP